MELSNEFCLREATEGDYEAVLNINRNVYTGNDYLPKLYSQWLEADSRRNFVITKQTNVVGFFSLSWYRHQKWTVFVEQALRIRSDVTGQNVSKLVVDWIKQYIKQYENPVFLSFGSKFTF